MNCAWCGANDDGSDSHGICEDCSMLHFGVKPVSMLQEGTDEEEENVQAI